MSLKMHHVTLLVLVMIAATASLPAAAQAQEIVINEVETNPPGDDSVSTEWVELYNPADASVDLGGWEIASTTGQKKALIIPSGTTLGPGEFVTLFHSRLWFSDIAEAVQLRNPDGTVVDQTPAVTDRTGDWNSWQRIYDGYDTDSESDWRFAMQNAGASNGKVATESDEIGVSIEVSAGKPGYLFGERAVISGSVSEKVWVEIPSFQPTVISVTVEGPEYSQEFLLYPDYLLRYEAGLDLHRILGITEGRYEVEVAYAGATARTSFTVGDPDIIIPESTAGELSIWIDRDSYQIGETVKITGAATETIPFAGMRLVVINPEGAAVLNGTLYPDAAGMFSTELYMEPSSPSFGVHEVIAEYASMRAESSFVLKEVEYGDEVITMRTEKPAYELGQTAVITGIVSLPQVVLLDLVVQQVGGGPGHAGTLHKSIDSVRLNDDGSFRYEYSVGSDPARYGEYRVTASKDSFSQVVFFRVEEGAGMTPGGAVEPLTIRTDNNVYESGSNVIIRGKVNDILQIGSSYVNTVGIRIERVGGGDSGVTMTAVPDIAGNFAAEATLHKPAYPDGEYVIIATYANRHETRSTFTISSYDAATGQFDLKINREVFGLGEEVVVIGTIPGLGQASGVIITLYKPDGDRDEFGAYIEGSEFTWRWNTPMFEKDESAIEGRSDAKSNYGVYRVDFSTSSQTSSVFFKVSPDPDNDELGTAEIEVSTDKEIYQAGQEISISGFAKKRVIGLGGTVVEERAYVTIKEMSPPYRTLYESFLFLDYVGYFGAEYNLPIGVFDEGRYIVTAEYGGKTARTEFTVLNEIRLGEDADLGLIIETDRKEYAPGDTLHMTGYLSRLVHVEGVEITIFREDEKQVKCGSFICGVPEASGTIVPTGSGLLRYSYIIPGDNAEGEYEILASTKFGTFSTGFTVAGAAPVEEVEYRVTEKFNRITDSQIPITIETRELDGREMFPRALHGSVFTPARADDVAVNLRVTSPGGTCVIGPAGECAVSELTKSQGGIYINAEIDGQWYKIRYSGPGVILEKFSILPVDEGAIRAGEWEVEIIKEDQPSKFYYKITYVTTGS